MITPDEQRRVAQAVHMLHEFFPNVQILVSRVENGDTHSFKLGAGDWWARRGLAQNFLDVGKANEDAAILQHYLRNDNDDQS